MIQLLLTILLILTTLLLILLYDIRKAIKTKIPVLSIIETCLESLKKEIGILKNEVERIKKTQD